MKTSLDATIDQITRYDAPAPRLLAHLGHGVVRVFLGDHKVTQGELIHVSTTGEVLRLVEILGQSEGIARTLNMTLDAAIDSPILPAGEQALFPAPQAQKLALVGQSYVSDSLPDALPVHLTPPTFAQLDGARDVLPTGIEAIDLLSPLSRGGVNLILDMSATRDGFEALIARAQRALGDATRAITVHAHTPHGAPFREVRAANTSREAFYMALRAAVSWCVRCRERGEEQLFYAALPTISGEEALSAYHVETSQRSGQEMTYAEIVNWLGEHVTSTRDARVTTLLTLSMPGVGGSNDAIIDSMNLGDVDALIIIDALGRYSPRQSRSRTPQAPERAAQATRLRGVLHRAALLKEKQQVFGDDDLSPEELALIDEADRWQPSIGA